MLAVYGNLVDKEVSECLLRSGVSISTESTDCVLLANVMDEPKFLSDAVASKIRPDSIIPFV